MSVTSQVTIPKNYVSLRSFAIFGIAFFLISAVLTAFVIIPRVNELLTSEHSNNVNDELVLEARLFTNFVDGQRTILQDLAEFPSLVNASMMSDASDPVLTDLFDKIVIGGEQGRLVLQDIAGAVLIRSVDNLQGNYLKGNAVVDQLVEGVIPYSFRLLGQSDDLFTFQISVPVIYRSSIEGVLSAEITAPLSQAFIAHSTEDHVAFRVSQNEVTIRTDSSRIDIAHEISVRLEDPNVLFTYISDNAIIQSKQRSLRNIILTVLLAGLAVSFLLFALFEYNLLRGDLQGIGKLAFSRVYLVPILIAIVGVAASITANLMIRNIQQLSVEKELLVESKSQVKIIGDRVRGKLDSLDSIGALYDASDFVSRQEFKTFATYVTASHPSIRVVEWVPVVALEKRTEFENQARADGLSEYSIRELNDQGQAVVAGTREYYFPVYYAEPATGNEQAFGFDYASNNQRLAVITQAGSSGSKVATAPVKLPYSHHTSEAVLVFNPVYRLSAPESPGAVGFERIRGFIVLVMSVEDLIAETLASDNRLESVRIVDVSELNIADVISDDEVASRGYPYHETIEVAGRAWRIEMVMNSSAFTASVWWVPVLVFFGGLVFTAMITMGLVHQIRRREVVESLVKTRTAKLRSLSSIAANSNDIFMITDANLPNSDNALGDIVYVNDAFSRITGYSFTDAIGQQPRDLLVGHKTDQSQLRKLRESTSRGNSYRGEYVCYTKNKDEYWADVNVVPLADEGGDIHQFATIIRDISDRKSADDERERLIGKLTESNEELERFAYVCSHDLQEPLRMIRSFSEKLETHIKPDLIGDEKGSKYLRFVTDGAARAQILISDILAYSSIEDDMQKRQRVDIVALVENIKKEMSTTLGDIGGEITWEELPDLQGNKTQLYQLFQNLINNAIKYRKSDTAPHVHVGIQDIGKYWQFSINDNGIGMENRHQHKIFDLFQRLHGRSKYAGTGVGLSICKKVVERHGGSLWVESEYGVGSTFYFTLPKQIVSEVTDERRRTAG